MKTTLEKIKSYNPCERGWKKILSNFGSDLDKEIDFKDILKSNGIQDTIWILKVITNEEDRMAIMSFYADVTESGLKKFEKEYPKDNRPRKAIEGVRDFVKGKIGREVLKRLCDSIYDRSADISVYTYYKPSPVLFAANAAYAAANISRFDIYATCNAATYAFYADSYTKWRKIEEMLLKYI